MDSLIVQVNKIGKVIGPVNYSIAHPKKNKKGIRHATTNLLLFEDYSEKRLLLQKRRNFNRESKLDCSAGGHVEWLEKEGKAEKVEKTMYRETNEELFFGFEIPEKLTLEKICAFSKSTRPNDLEFTYLFKGHYPGPFYINNEEVEEVYFKDVEIILEDIKNKSKDYTNTFKVCLIEYINRKNKLK